MIKYHKTILEEYTLAQPETTELLQVAIDTKINRVISTWINYLIIWLFSLVVFDVLAVQQIEYHNQIKRTLRCMYPNIIKGTKHPGVIAFYIHPRSDMVFAWLLR